jgi:hypothetical protein
MAAILIVAQKQFFGVVLPQEPQFERGNFDLYFRGHRFNSESDPPHDPTLSKAPEDRADNRFCILH